MSATHCNERQQDAENVRQPRSRVAQRLNVEERPSDIPNTEWDFPFAKIY
jgi:hypothetical protein